MGWREAVDGSCGEDMMTLLAFRFQSWARIVLYLPVEVPVRRGPEKIFCDSLATPLRP
jgi:hypothetical protein